MRTEDVVPSTEHPPMVIFSALLPMTWSAITENAARCYNRRMNTQHAERIILIGPSGSGKTTAGSQVAALLGWGFVDTDELVEHAAGKTIAQIFAEEGEPRFRELEAAALRDAHTRRHVVIATGGGIGERAENRSIMRAHGWLVALDVAREIALERMHATAVSAAIGAVRPLLAGDAPAGRWQALYDQRQEWYAAADECITCDTLTTEQVAARIVAGVIARGLLAPTGATEATHRIHTASGTGYDAVVAWGGLATLSARLAALKLPPRLHIVADATVASLYAVPLSESLAHAGFAPEIYHVPAGEASKSREQLNAIHDWLVERRAERGEAVIALGGGVIGDLAGFAAATYLRGVPLVQLPTSLLAQVDASIGGKVAIDHPHGKNLIGAFYPPRLVLADPAVLLTMPRRQRIEGWAEVIKHGVALDAAYFARLESDVDALLALRPAETTAAIAGSVAIKGAIVAGDEREGEGGWRHLLNYGHTIGHAIEAVTGYGAWLHGEAVAAGMMAAAQLGQRICVTPAEIVTRQEALLTRFGLPIRAEGFSAAALMRAALWDKKVRGGKVRWVLPTALGSSTLIGDIPDEDVRAALLAIGAVDDYPPSFL